MGQPNNAIDIFAERLDGSIVDVGPTLPPSAPSGLSPEAEANQVGLGAPGASADGAHVFFTLKNTFWPFDGTQAGHESLYEYAGTGNPSPLLVGVDENGGQGDQISDCGTLLGGGSPSGSMDSGHNAVSKNGEVVFFTAYPPGNGCNAPGPPVTELFARIDNGGPDAHTVAISEPSEGCSECQTKPEVLAGAHFEGASEDGSKVFFSTTQPLLGEDATENLYEAEIGCQQTLETDCQAFHEALHLKRIVRVSEPAATVSRSTKAEVQGHVVQVSEDGSHVYFVANGVLTADENAAGLRARRGADNLYVFEPAPESEAEGQNKLAFIADLCSGPGMSGSVSDGRCPSSLSASESPTGNAPNGNDVGLWATFNQEGSNVTPDGRFLVFVSYGDLTPDDTSGARQVFEYDALTGRLVRVSIGQGGYNDNGNTSTNNAEIVSPVYTATTNVEPNAFPSTYWSSLSVSEDGSYVYFQSGDGLTKQAVNQDIIGEQVEGQGHPNRIIYANNIYEYHSLNGDIAEGNVSLISDGEDIHTYNGQGAVALLGANASGRDVFFTTLDRLVPQATSEADDIYDARIGGGFPPPAPLPECSGDACQGSLSGTSTLLSPGSEFQVGGNPPLASPTPLVEATSKSKAAVKPKRKAKKAKRARRRAADVRKGAHP
ncbi:MAG TPA: hypothetical protein VNY52_06385 [Solirubrobacteraceae bacterium]|nr:hypothetical protein [Solirubrobacteraceae bacterium]